jgi:hypothetical protein
MCAFGGLSKGLQRMSVFVLTSVGTKKFCTGDLRGVANRLVLATRTYMYDVCINDKRLFLAVPFMFQIEEMIG